MFSVKAVVVEALLVAALGLLFGVAANALSPTGLQLARNYFPDPGPPRAVTSAGQVGAPPALEKDTISPNATIQRLTGRGLHTADIGEVTTLFRDSRYEQELIVFIDARDDQQYSAGHIPGAWQFHHYRAEKYLPTILPVCLAAEKVVLYCSGGECEDSEFAAIMLRDAGVPSESILVYPGGIREWKARGLPVETGLRRSGQLLAKP